MVHKHNGRLFVARHPAKIIVGNYIMQWEPNEGRRTRKNTNANTRATEKEHAKDIKRRTMGRMHSGRMDKQKTPTTFCWTTAQKIQQEHPNNNTTINYVYWSYNEFQTCYIEYIILIPSAARRLWELTHYMDADVNPPSPAIYLIQYKQIVCVHPNTIWDDTRWY